MLVLYQTLTPTVQQVLIWVPQTSQWKDLYVSPETSYTLMVNKLSVTIVVQLLSQQTLTQSSKVTGGSGSGLLQLDRPWYPITKSNYNSGVGINVSR